LRVLTFYNLKHLIDAQLNYNTKNRRRVEKILAKFIPKLERLLTEEHYE